MIRPPVPPAPRGSPSLCPSYRDSKHVIDRGRGQRGISMEESRQRSERGLVQICGVVRDPCGRVEWSRRDHFSCRFRRSSSSTLNGTSACAASNSAPPAAENPDKLSGAFTPNATVIARPKVVRRAPLNKATRRVLQPRTRRRPKSVSAAVAIIANAGIMAAGKTPIELGRIVHEPGIVAPRHIGLSINAPEAKPVCDDRQERDPQSEAEKYRAERRQSVHRGPPFHGALPNG